MIQVTLKSLSAQRGVALVMALVFLMLLTLLGVTSMGTSSLEEKMASNTRDRNLAFQAAETALLTAETWLSTKTSEPTPWPDTTKGLYTPATGNTPVWDDTSISWTTSTALISYPCTADDSTQSIASSCTSGGRTSLSGVATQPKYIIEKMGPVDSAVPTTIAYRITARGTGGSNAAVVMLQSTYVRAY